MIFVPILVRHDHAGDDVTGYFRISDNKYRIYTDLQSSAGKRGNIGNRN